MSTIVAQFIAYEQGDMADDEVDAFFQELVDTGVAWALQGHYGRTAIALIAQGRVTLKEATDGEFE